jgi:ligand-binding sensor domain-containing protein
VKPAVEQIGGLTLGALVALCWTDRPPVAGAAQARLWRPEDRALVSDFSTVQAVAASPFTVFAATTHGLTIYDRPAGRWRLPVTSLEGYPAARVRVALADGVGDAVWLGTDQGWARYDATVRSWEQGVVPGGVGNLMLDARDLASGVFVQGAFGWGFLSRGALFPVPNRPLPPPGDRVQPLEPRTALNQTPMADAMRALILTDPLLRGYHFTAAARSPDRSELFFGSDGLGVIRVDPTTGGWERLSFGLVAARAGAVALGAGGVWVASAGRVAERRGLTWVAADLSADTAIEGAGTLGFPCVDGRRLIASGRSLWLACERGVVKIDAGGGRSGGGGGGARTRLFAVDDAHALAPAPDGVWVGSARGLAVITLDEKLVPVVDLGQPVLALAAVRESLWVGTPSGLGLLGPGTSEVVVPPDVADQPALRAPIVALVTRGDTLVVVTSDQLAWRDPATRHWTLERAGAELGRVTALAADEGGVWIAATEGVAFWDIPHATFHALTVPFDVPAAAHDVAVDAVHVWVATDSGLVRFARAAARR